MEDLGKAVFGLIIIQPGNTDCYLTKVAFRARQIPWKLCYGGGMRLYIWYKFPPENAG